MSLVIASTKLLFLLYPLIQNLSALSKLMDYEC